MRSRSFYGFLFITTFYGCHDRLAPLAPEYPLEIKNNKVFLDETPGLYQVVTIGERRYCYFWKKTEEGDDFFIHDKDCDNRSDRVLVTRGDQIVFGYDRKDLPRKTRQNLDYVLQNHITDNIK